MNKTRALALVATMLAGVGGAALADASRASDGLAESYSFAGTRRRLPSMSQAKARRIRRRSGHR